jgi:phage baseplate assembly protein W
MNIAFPLQFDSRGRTAEAAEDDHVRDLVGQLLFTAPGERVNRPAFGSGALQLVFSPNGAELATATQLMVQGALQQWLGELIQVQAVEVRNEDAKLEVTVRYVLRRTQQSRVARFTGGAS